MLVQDWMTDKVLTLGPEDTAADVLDLFNDHDIRHVAIVDEDGDVVGMISDRAVLRNTFGSRQGALPQTLREDVLASRSVASLLSSDPLTASPDDSLAEAALSMLENKVGCLLVTEGTRLVGILTEADFVRYVAEKCT